MAATSYLTNEFPHTDMEQTVAIVQNNTFDEAKKLGLAEYCVAYMSGYCANGDRCPYKHPEKQDRIKNPEMCKYWYRAICQKNNKCDHIHICDISFLPECKYYAQSSLFYISFCPLESISRSPFLS